MRWVATAFCFDREEGYSVSWEGDRVTVEHHKQNGTVNIEVTAGNSRRAYIVIPVALLQAKGIVTIAEKPVIDDDMDFG